MKNKISSIAVSIAVIIFAASLLTSCNRNDYWEDDTIYGTWGNYYYDPDYGSYLYSMTFRADGVCAVSYVYDYYPQYNETYFFDYTLDGFLYEGAYLSVFGRYPDGYVKNDQFDAYSNGYTLELYGVRGEFAGTNLSLRRL